MTKSTYFKKCVHDSGEDTSHGLITKLIDRDKVEMARKSRRDGIPATAWRSHRCHELNVLQKERGGVLLIVPVAVVNVHAKQLNGRLCTILLHLRHIHVIHKEHSLFHHRRAEHSLPSLVQPRHEDLLHLVGRCLGTEVDEEGHVLLFAERIHQVVLNVGAFTCHK